jgi:hypothetical protein
MKPRPESCPGNSRGKTLGSVSHFEVMPLAEFGRRMNMGPRALADAQRAGLRTIVFGRVKYVTGGDALAWFDRLATAQHGPTGQPINGQRLVDLEARGQ